MAMQIACPKCQRRYQVKPEMAGKTMKCPACQAQFVLNLKHRAPGSTPNPPRTAGPSTQDYARFGLEGPLPGNPDIFPADAGKKPPPEPLGNAIEDPGFADIDPRRFVVPEERAELDPVYTNPALTHSSAMSAAKKKIGRAQNAYQSNAKLVRSITLLFIALYVMPVAGLLAIVFGAMGSGPGRPARGMDMTAIVAGIFVLILVILSISAVVSFLMFIYRANQNARALGAAGMKFSPGWSVGWWFVPFANVVLPYLAVGEILKASRPGATGQEWQKASFPAVVLVWWIASLVPLTSVFSMAISIFVVRAIHHEQEANLK